MYCVVVFTLRDLVMKKLKLLVLLYGVSFYSFSFGSVVTDPVSYSYYATQVETAINELKNGEIQLETIQKSLDMAKDTYNSVSSIDSNLSGNLKRANKTISNLQKMDIKEFEETLQFAKKSLDEVENIGNYKSGVETEIDNVFVESDRKDWVNVELEKKAAKQKAFKTAIIDAELAQGKATLQVKHLEELALATDSANTSKDAQDVTNSLLLTMIDNQRELITLMASVSKNIALSEYNGEEDAPADAKVNNGRDITNKDDYKTKRIKVINNPFKDKWKK